MDFDPNDRYHSQMSRKPTIDPSQDTRQRVISAAIRLYSDKGMENVSLRELTAAADVNLGAVNYHFGTKDALCEGVMDSLAASINERRLTLLRKILSDADEKGIAPHLEAILDTFMAPYIDPDFGNDGALLAQLVLKHRQSPNEMTTRLVRKHFDPLAREYIAAFAKACPEIEPDAFYWRYMFMAGTILITSTDRNKSNRVATISNDQYDASDTVALHRSLMNFLVAGIKAASKP